MLSYIIKYNIIYGVSVAAACIISRWIMWKAGWYPISRIVTICCQLNPTQFQKLVLNYLHSEMRIQLIHGIAR